MPSARRQKAKARPPPRKAAPARKPAPKKAPSPRKAAPSKTPAKTSRAPSAKPAGTAKASVAPPLPVVRRSDGRVHVLSLSFVRDGDEFLARMEQDSGQITELKNRSLDQLLTLVASELEDLLE
jgi:outer membrane biosynthesis protein TonB